MTDPPYSCPHCGDHLKKWRVPEGASWEEDLFLVCFNNDCSYYQNGWTWMKEQFGQVGSYRYVLNPINGSSSMIAVWSDEATREMVVDDEEG